MSGAKEKHSGQECFSPMSNYSSERREVQVFKRGQVLNNDADFDHAMWFGRHVEVWQNEKLIDYGGKIEMYTDDAVKINGAYFLRRNCEFRIR